MGVPKFFRFISERYPCLSEVVKEYEIPEFDNFYIDANGIIHNCSHPDDNPHFRISEEEIFKDIFYYLEMLFRIIKPKKLFFIAIDGVAPRAKMNQQRGRRFRTAKDAEKAIEEAVKKGEKLPNTERFDSNCITPGTVFMEKLHRQLQYFIKKKISTDESWQRPKIILSGHNVPGEGEHKIMDYIRYLRSQSDWNPNTRHCLHGLDADLIMLGLCTHEPHFSLLREEVKFGRNDKKKTNAEEVKFYLLHLSLMRDYLDLEFQGLKDKLPFEYDIERIIDDWVLMGFLVGNDFIPNLPHFHIANNALHLLYKAYIDVLPYLDGYINNSGVLNMERFEKYLRRLALFDFENFKDTFSDLEYFESKTGKSFPGSSTHDFEKLDNEVIALAMETDRMFGVESGSDDDSEDETLREEFLIYKTEFYKHKLEYDKVDSETLKEQAEGYIRAIQWNLYYYYTGCPSWSWYYPHHYSPYVSDIKGFSGLDVIFEPSTPFLPFQQLLAVLPAASKSIVPEPFQKLMTSPESPIINFYPSDFKTDLNGKKHDWEAVVLIPFIDEKSLLSAMQPHYKDLSEEENMRNSVKPMEIYTYTSKSLGICEAPEYFPPIMNNYAQLTPLATSDIALKPNQVVKGRLPGTISGAYLGFPHLSGIQFTACLRPMKVKVFEQPSRGDNMILEINYKKIDDEDEIQAIANDLMGQIIFVGWPHIQRGKVTSILTEKYQFRFQQAGKITRYENKDMYYGLDSVEIQRNHQMTLGINLGKVDIVVLVKTVEGKAYEFKGKKGCLKYLWSRTSTPFPYQTILRTAAVLDEDESQMAIEKNLEDIFYKGSDVFLLSLKNYGSYGKVVKVTEEGEVEVNLYVKPDIDLSGIMELSANTDLTYYTGNVAAQRLGLGSHLFSRVTGCVFIQNIENEEKLNIGLGLKFTKQGEELIGFTRKEGNMWLYSEKTIALVNDYMDKFPELFEYLEKNSGNEIFFNKDVFPKNMKEKIAEIKEWLKNQPHNSAERRQSGGKLLSNEAMKEIEKRVVAADPGKTLSTEHVLVQPSMIYIPATSIQKAPPDPSVKIQLLDRIIAVRMNHCIPIGLCGTVIGYDKPSCSVNTLYDILFDEPVIGGRSFGCVSARVYRLPYQTFINTCHGKREFGKLNVSGKTKMEDFINKQDDWRSHCVRSSFKNDNNMSLSSPSKDSGASLQDIGNVKVKQFFDGYMNFGKTTSTPPVNSMAFFPNNRTPSNRQELLGADSEFHAFWNVLQSNKAPEEKSLHPKVPVNDEPPPSVETAVVEQTNALRKLLKLVDSPSSAGSDLQSSGELRPQVPMNQPPSIKGRTPTNSTNKFPPAQVRQLRPCGHLGCCTELVQLCTTKNIPYPVYKYNRVPPSGDVTCTVTFVSDYNYGCHVGEPCRTKEEAAESAACRAIRFILQRDEVRRMPIPLGMGYRPLLPGIRHNSPTIRAMGPLPTPPMQWCSSRKQVRGDNSNRRSPRGATPPNHGQQYQRHTPSGSSVEGSSGPGSNERVSNMNKSEGERKERGGGGNVESGLPYKPNASKPMPKRGAGRLRPRIAANFSIPISNNNNNNQTS